jgi:hypothetical protein
MRQTTKAFFLAIARWALLAVIALWLASAYFSPRLIGTPDALWYHHLLADAVTQFRAGVFPVYVGQSDYSFNGSIYPLRAAPYFQYLAGMLDLVTGRKLSFFALQHLTVIISFVAGAFTTYRALIWIAPKRTWTALVLALLYILCPGVAGLFYAQDLYMSGMTIPWVPLGFAALIRSFDDDGLRPMAILAASLAALWWAHSPIALWATFIATLGQIVRLFVRRPNGPELVRSCLAAMIFCALAVYPIASVFLLRTRGESIVPYVMDRQLLLEWVRGSFPSSIEPINLGLSGLSHLQLGYGLWLVFLGSLVAWCRQVRLWAVGVLLASVVLMLILVFPVPGITKALWYGFPETLVGMTLYWPMQRFYILIAAAIVVSAQRLFAQFSIGNRTALVASYGCLLAAALWSATEASKLRHQALSQSGTVEESSKLALTENVAVQRHTYGLFARRPSYFSHGVVDARMEAHLLDPATGKIVGSDYDLARNDRPSGELQGSIDVNPGILDLNPPLTLMPGVRYLLTFDFAHADTTGIFQMNGDHFFREYGLPQSGESKAFGSGPENEKSVVLWTSLSNPETVRMRFIPTAANAKPADYTPFAKFNLEPIDPASLPIRADSLIPYTAEVRSLQAALFESPRMFVPGYRAEVNGLEVPVSKSAEGLVQFPIPAGESRVLLRFIGPVMLRIAFWLNFAGWIAAFAVMLVSLSGFLRRKRA